jgi:hypothetical protein
MHFEKNWSESKKSTTKNLYVGTLKLLMTLYDVCLVGYFGTIPSEVRSNAYQYPITVS